jgi:hypothetical protein
MKVICIDSSNKPNKVPDNEWIEEGVVYTVVLVRQMGLQKGRIGVKLKEVELSDSSFPYEFYDFERFLPINLLTQLYHEERVTEKADLELI